jgi:SagB-type dehydrogenase family enzyme
MSEQFVINPALTVSPRFDSKPANDGECFSLAWQGNGIACNLPFLKIVLGFKEPIAVKDAVEVLIKSNAKLSRQEIEDGIKNCLTHNILVKSDEVNEALAWHLNGWGDSYAYHQASRDQDFHDQTPETAWEDKERVVQNYLSTEKPPATELNLSALPLVKLPAPQKISANFYDALMARRTSRNFLPQPVALQDLSSIFHGATMPMKTTRSEAAELSKDHLSMHLHSWLTFAEIGFYAHNCEGLEQGLYFYDVREHGVRQLRAGDFSDLINKASWKQGVEGASLVIFIMADLNRYMWKYRNPRHYKAVWVQSAALAHRFILAAQGAGYGSFQSPAMHDETAIAMFETSVDKLMPIYMVGLGPSGKN